MKNLVYRIFIDNEHSVEFSFNANHDMIIELYDEENNFIGCSIPNDEDRKELIEYLQKADEYIDSHKEKE